MVSIWFDIILLHSFNSLSMVSFSSLSILVRADLQSLPRKSNIWAFLEFFPNNCLLLPSGSYFPVSYFIIFVENWTFYIIWQCWESNSPSPEFIIVAMCYLFLWLLLQLPFICFFCDFPGLGKTHVFCCCCCCCYIWDILYVILWDYGSYLIFFLAVIVQGPGGCICSASCQDLPKHPGQNGALSHAPLLQMGRVKVQILHHLIVICLGKVGHWLTSHCRLWVMCDQLTAWLYCLPGGKEEWAEGWLAPFCYFG